MLNRFSYSLVVVAGLAIPLAAHAKIRVGDRAAEISRLHDGAGKTLSLRAMRDQIVVISFGASWCPPCKKELPALEKIAERLKGQPVKFIAVNIATELAKGKRFVHEVGLHLVHALYDPQGAIIKNYDPPKMPTTYIIRRGVVVHMHAGFSKGDEKGLRRVINQQLAKR